jgi:hypothetical protein
LLKLPEIAESTERKTEKLTTKAPRHQGMQMETWKPCQFFLVPLCAPQGHPSSAPLKGTRRAGIEKKVLKERY